MSRGSPWATNYQLYGDIIILLNFIFIGLRSYKITPGLSTNKQRHCLLLLKRGIHVAPTHLQVMLSFGKYIKGLKNKIHTAVRRNLEEILEVKTFLKISKGFKYRGPNVELRFCSFLGCVHFSTTGTDKEK